MEKLNIKEAKYTALEADGDKKQLRCIAPDGSIDRIDMAQMTTEQAYAYFMGDVSTEKKTATDIEKIM